MNENEIVLQKILKDSGHIFKQECLTMPVIALDGLLKHVKTLPKLHGSMTQGLIVPNQHFRPWNDDTEHTKGASIKARTLTTRHCEVKHKMSPENLFLTIYGKSVAESQVNNATVRRILTEMMAKASEGLYDTVFRGVYNPSGEGNLDNFDGLDTIINAEKAAGNISFAQGNFLPLDEITVANIGDKLQMLWQMADVRLRGDSTKKLKLFMPMELGFLYDQWHANIYGTANFTGNEYHQRFLEGTQHQVEIVCLPGMEGVGHIFITTQENLWFGYDIDSSFTHFSAGIPITDTHNIYANADIFMGVDFACVEKEFLMAASFTAKKSFKAAFTSRESIDFGFFNKIGDAKEERIVFQGIGLTAATEVKVVSEKREGSFEVKTDKAKISADEANAVGGVEVEVTCVFKSHSEDFKYEIQFVNEADGIERKVPVSMSFEENS